MTDQTRKLWKFEIDGKVVTRMGYTMIGAKNALIAETGRLRRDIKSLED